MVSTPRHFVFFFVSFERSNQWFFCMSLPQTNWDQVAKDLTRALLSETTPKLSEAFATIDDMFFNMAEAGRAEHFDTLRVLRNNKNPLLASWPLHVSQATAAWGTKKSTREKLVELSLVDDDEMEERLAIDQMTETFGKKQGATFQAFALFWERWPEAVHPEAPITARGLSLLVCKWLGDLPINTAERVLVLKIMERHFLKAIPGILDQTSDILKNYGFLVPDMTSPKSFARAATARPERLNAPTRTEPTTVAASFNKNDQRNDQRDEMRHDRVRQESALSSHQSTSAERYLNKEHAGAYPHQEDNIAVGPWPGSQNSSYLGHADAARQTLEPHLARGLLQAFQELMSGDRRPVARTSGAARGGERGANPVLNELPSPTNSPSVDLNDVDGALLDLLGVLKKRREERSVREDAGAHPVIGGEILRGVLDDMQKSLPSAVAKAARQNDQTLAEQFKKSMLENAVRAGRVLPGSQLNDQDEDAVDIVGMLFEIFLTERQIAADMREDIARLLAPYVKVAIGDRKMFMQKSHPARKFLDVLAEACEGNEGVSPQEKATLSKVTGSIDQIVADFNEDIAIFEMIEGEIKEFLEKQRAVARLAEKRALEAERGRERLEIAKKQAISFFRDKTTECDWPAKTLDLLRNTWCQHYVLLLLKPKEDVFEEKDRQALFEAADLLDRIVELGTNGPGGVSLSKTKSDMARMLHSSGILGKSADDLVDTLMKALDQARLLKRMIDAGEVVEPIENNQALALPETVTFEAPSDEKDREIERLREELRLRDLERQKLTEKNLEEGARAQDSGGRKQAEEKQTEESESWPPFVSVGVFHQMKISNDELLHYFKTMEIGTWVDFVKPSGAIVNTKLSWVSPISGRLLFVTARGQKHAVEAPEEMVMMVRLERVRLRETGLGQGGFDQSYQGAISRMKEQVAG